MPKQCTNATKSHDLLPICVLSSGNLEFGSQFTIYPLRIRVDIIITHAKKNGDPDPATARIIGSGSKTPGSATLIFSHVILSCSIAPRPCTLNEDCGSQTDRIPDIATHQKKNIRVDPRFSKTGSCLKDLGIEFAAIFVINI